MTQKRVNGSQFKPTGRYCSWDNLSRLNPGVVKPQPKPQNFTAKSGSHTRKTSQFNEPIYNKRDNNNQDKEVYVPSHKSSTASRWATVSNDDNDKTPQSQQSHSNDLNNSNNHSKFSTMDNNKLPNTSSSIWAPATTTTPATSTNKSNGNNVKPTTISTNANDRSRKLPPRGPKNPDILNPDRRRSQMRSSSNNSVNDLLSRLKAATNHKQHLSNQNNQNTSHSKNFVPPSEPKKMRNQETVSQHQQNSQPKVTSHENNFISWTDERNTKSQSSQSQHSKHTPQLSHQSSNISWADEGFELPDVNDLKI